MLDFESNMPFWHPIRDALRIDFRFPNEINSKVRDWVQGPLREVNYSNNNKNKNGLKILTSKPSNPHIRKDRQKAHLGQEGHKENNLPFSDETSCIRRVKLFLEEIEEVLERREA